MGGETSNSVVWDVCLLGVLDRQRPHRGRESTEITNRGKEGGGEQYKWEKFHLEAFAEEHDGRLPRFNIVSGRLR